MKTVTQGRQNEKAALLPTALIRCEGHGFKKLTRHLQLKMSGCSAGRITLHLILALKTARYTWHLQGIARELTRR